MNASWIFPFIVLGGALPRYAIDYKNVIGAWPEKHILGTRLGRNENGRLWPSRRQRAAVGR